MILTSSSIYAFVLCLLSTTMLIRFSYGFMTNGKVFSIHQYQQTQQLEKLHSSQVTRIYSQSVSGEIKKIDDGTSNESRFFHDIANDDIPDFEQCCKIHKTIQELRSQIPKLLTQSLTEEVAEKVYDEHFRLTIATKTVGDLKKDTTGTGNKKNEIILASSRQELVSLSNTIVLATTAARQANSLLVSTTLGSGRSNINNNRNAKNEVAVTSPPKVESNLTIDPSLQGIEVRWQTKLPRLDNRRGGGGNDNSQQFVLQGISLLIFNNTCGRINEHRLLQVRWNNQILDAPGIGQQLASLRQAVLSIQNSPLLQSISTSVPLFDNLLNQLRDDVIEQTTTMLLGDQTGQNKQQQKNQKDLSFTLPNVFVVESLDEYSKNKTDNNQKNANNNSTIINQTYSFPVNDCRITSSLSSPLPTFDDETDPSLSSFILQPPRPSPFPGSDQWNQYVSAYRTGNKFVQRTIPILSGTQQRTVGDRKVMAELFANNCTLISVEGSILLQGRDRVTNFYQNLASWRDRSALLTKWTMKNAKMVSNWENLSDDEVSVIIDYFANTSLPGMAPVSVQGTDKFVLYRPILQVQEEEEEEEILIKRIEQVDISIGGVKDTFGFMKSMTVALDSGTGIADSVIKELLQRAVLTRTAGRTTDDASARKKKRRNPVPPRLVDNAAARVYGIMSQLHRDVIPSLDAEYASSTTNSNTVRLRPPAYDYMTENFELRGYLGETLVRGLKSYNRVIGTVLTSWRTAVATGSVKLDKSPYVSIELTPIGNVRLSLTLYLKVYPGGAAATAAGEFISGVVPALSGAIAGSASPNFPMTISLVSDYVIEKETGLIYQHRLVESRVNGQLTPGDVLSRWIQNQGGEGLSRSSNSENEDMILRSLTDAFTWLRSMRKSTPDK